MAMEGRIGDTKLLHKIMKKWFYGVLIGLLLILFVLKNGLVNNQIEESQLSSPITFKISDARNALGDGVAPDVQSPQASSRVISADIITSSLFFQKNFSQKLQNSLQTWHFMEHIIDCSQGLPNAVEAIREAGFAWVSLMNAVENEEIGNKNRNMLKPKDNQCPYFLNKMNATEFGDKGYTLRIPCGLVQGSSITVIGIPNGLLGNFQIDLIGEPLSEDPTPPIVLHYNVRLNGDKVTVDSVIVQNTWTAASGWGDEDRCPPVVPGNNKKVDQLNQCNLMVGKNDSPKLTAGGSSNYSKPRQYFPFKQGYLSVLTLRVGEEGVQMTVDGKHTTSFAVRDRLEPWLVNEVRVSGDLDLISVFASGLPTSEDLDDMVDREALSSGPLALHKPLDLFIGVFSTANNFKRRMSVRRTWMQYIAVRSGAIAVRFFVGLHKNQMVNEELWNEVQTYEDIQLMPFIDYYDLITWKTLATCIFGTQVVSAKYVMKTDDDSFVRVNEVIASLERTIVSKGLLYGLINSNDRPQRNPDSKWYISPEEWREETYPPWAHGPGYIVSGDIANAIYNKHERGHLKMFKLEDVAMGIWISEMGKKGLQVSYVNEQRIHIEGCKDGYVIAHYQSPRQMLCLWQRLEEGKGAKCCEEL